MSLFDSMDLEGFQQSANSEPLYVFDLDNKKAEPDIHKWLITELDYLMDINRDRVQEIKQHYMLYKGLSPELSRRSSDRDTVIERNRIQPKLVLNDLYSLTEHSVARLVKFKPGVAILPTNQEFKDRQAAKIAEMFWSHIKTVQDFDGKVSDVVRRAKIAGEGYLFIEWDPELGEDHPDSSEEKIPLIGEHGEQIQDPSGKGMFIEQSVKVGDVCLKPYPPERLFFEKTDEFDKARYFFRLSLEDVELLRSKHPSKASKIKSKPELLNNTHLTEVLPKWKTHQIPVIELFYKPSPGMDGGRYIKFTHDAILTNKEYPYSHGQFPFARMPDIMIQGEQHAKSIYINTKRLAAQTNNLTTMITRNQKMVSHPKWFVPQGSIKMEDLNNDISIVQYKGTQPPILAQSSPTPSEIFNFRDQLRQETAEVFGIGPVSKADPPPGIKSGVALQFLAEMESERQNANILNYNAFIREVAKLTVKVASQYYKSQDKRTLMILGDDKWLAKQFEPEKLARPFEIRIQNSSALPESKAARVQVLMDLRQAFPGILTDQQVLDMLDLGQSDRFYSEATSATRKAELENELMLDGEEVSPEPWEMHIHHWIVHTVELQEPSFRTLPKEVQRIKQEHIMAHEYLMYETAQKNPGFAERMAQLNQFPLFYTPDTSAPPPSPQPPEGPVPPGAENLGAPTGAVGPEQTASAVPTQGEVGGPQGLPPQSSPATQSQQALPLQRESEILTRPPGNALTPSSSV